MEDVPPDLVGKDDTKGEASLKGHLLNGKDEEHGSQAYVPPDAKNDKQLIAADDLLRGVARASNTVPTTPSGTVTPMPDAAAPDGNATPPDSDDNSKTP
jgi:carboxyl-terminal processing protease